MKRITIHCRDCGAQQTFRGEDVFEIMNAIDVADWHDQGEEDKPSAKRGHCNGLCPKCHADMIKNAEESC